MGRSGHAGVMLVTVNLCLFCWAQTCPSYYVGNIGKQDQSRLPEFATVYINTLDVAPCTGTVYGWRFCSYPTSGGAPFQVSISMYRSHSDGSYHLLSGSLYELMLKDGIDEYTCQDRFLDPSQYFSVEKGDMVASCWQGTNRIELYGRSFRRSDLLASGGQCSQSIISDTNEVILRALSLRAYINIDECFLGKYMCHKNATCSDVVGGEDSYNCTCNSGYSGDGFSECVESRKEGKTSTDSNEGGTNSGLIGMGTGSVVAIVIVLLLLLAGLIVIAVLISLFFYRRRLEESTPITHYHDNKLYAKHCEKKTSDADLTYGIPQEQEAVYELLEPRSEPYIMSDNVYEPIAEGNIYFTLEPPAENGGTAFCQLPTAYEAIYEQTVAIENIHESASQYQCPAQEENKLYEQISSHNIKVIPRKEIRFISYLGCGEFGSVSKAEWMTGSKQLSVAVKTLIDSTNTVRFLQEAAIMAQFRHPNILTLHGVVSAGNPKMIVTELMQNGDLKEYVTTMRPDPGQLVTDSIPKQLFNISKQVALGLHYLACMGFVHRDLAARNVLISNGRCKIADFGMSRDLTDDDIYVSHGGVVPIRWTAPEAISQKRYSTASDVWSYGCVLYEIWSLGHKPFQTSQVHQIPQLIKDGYRLPPPPGCPKSIYTLMIDTWHPDVPSRPKPKDILRALSGRILGILPEEVPGGSQATVLGAPLHAAKHLYLTLQHAYM